MSVCVRQGVTKGVFCAVAGRLPLGDGRGDAWMAPLRVEELSPIDLRTCTAWASDPWLAASEAVSLYLASLHADAVMGAACR